MNRSRVLESLIIAAVTAVLSSIGSSFVTSTVMTARLDERMTALQRNVDQIARDVERLRDDLYLPVRGTPKPAGGAHDYSAAGAR